MDLSQRKEQFSNAYIRAVAAVAGFALAKPETDDDSVDYTLSARGDGRLARRPKLDLQLKATEQDRAGDATVQFPLPLKNYEDLRPDNVLVPRVLVVLLLPPDIEHWLDQSQEAMTLRRCAYWVSLRGLPDTPNTATVTVSIPRANVFTPEALSGLMRRVDAGGAP